MIVEQPDHIPARNYWVVYAILIGLTLLTVFTARIAPLPDPWHTLLALIIAGAKAILVVLIFMHVWYSTRLTWVVATGSIAWLVILIVLTLNDYLTREWDKRAMPQRNATESLR